MSQFLICIVFVVYVCFTQGQIWIALFVQHSLLLMGRPGYCSEQYNFNTLTTGKCWYDTSRKRVIAMNTFTWKDGSCIIPFSSRPYHTFIMDTVAVWPQSFEKKKKVIASVCMISWDEAMFVTGHQCFFYSVRTVKFPHVDTHFFSWKFQECRGYSLKFCLSNESCRWRHVFTCKNAIYLASPCIYSIS